MKTMDYFKELHNAKEVWFYFEDEETKKALEKDLDIDLSAFDKTVRFDNTFKTWCEVSGKLWSIYNQCGGDCIFGGIVFIDYKKYLNHEPYILERDAPIEL